MGRFCELHRPSGVSRVTGGLGHAVERVHPLGQVMVVLPVLVPLQTLIGRLVGPAFVQLLSDAQTPHGRMALPLLLIKAADPAVSGVVITVPAQGVMHLAYESQA